MLTINLLQALPKTPLWDRLQRDGRLIDDDRAGKQRALPAPVRRGRGMWRRCIAHAYAPERLFERFRASGRSDLRQPLLTPGARQAHLANLRSWRCARLQHRSAHRAARRTIAALLAGGLAGAAPRPDRAALWHGLCRASPDPVFARSAARRAERLVLFGADAPDVGAGSAAARIRGAAEVGLTRPDGSFARGYVRYETDRAGRGDLRIRYDPSLLNQLRIADLRLRTAFEVNTGTAFGASQCSA